MTAHELAIETIIRRYDLQDSDRELAIPASQFYIGFMMFREDRDLRLPGEFHYQVAWSDGFREVYVSEPDRAIFTYCEGDLNMTVDDDEGVFQARLGSAAEFYGGAYRPVVGGAQ